MKHGTADQLHVEVTQSNGAPRGLTHGGKCFRNQLLESAVFRCAQGLVGLFDLALQLFASFRVRR